MTNRGSGAMIYERKKDNRVKATASITISAALIYHVLVGCCAHHAHGAVLPAAGIKNEVQSLSTARSCSKHRHDASTTAESGHECDPESTPHPDCEEPSCTYVVAKQTTVESPLTDAGFFIAAPIGALSELLRRDRGDWLVVPAHGPPLRSHLLCQVFLL